jgi:hypothetical protein
VNRFTILSNFVQIVVFLEASARDASSDASSSAESDRHPIVVDDDGHGAAALAVAEHALELRGVFLDVDVLERDMPPLIVVTGGLRVGSSVLAEDVDHALIVRGLTGGRMGV